VKAGVNREVTLITTIKTSEKYYWNTLLTNLPISGYWSAMHMGWLIAFISIGIKGEDTTAHREI
jgi:hypothetical protein